MFKCSLLDLKLWNSGLMVKSFGRFSSLVLLVNSIMHCCPSNALTVRKLWNFIILFVLWNLIDTCCKRNTRREHKRWMFHLIGFLNNSSTYQENLAFQLHFCETGCGHVQSIGSARLTYQMKRVCLRAVRLLLIFADTLFCVRFLLREKKNKIFSKYFLMIGLQQWRLRNGIFF